MKSASAELSLDLLTVSALSGAERALDTCAQLERAGRVDGAGAVKTVVLGRGVVVPMSWS